MLRFQHLNYFYPLYLQEFFDRHPTLPDEPFAVQQAALFGDMFHTADFYSLALQKLGYETDDVVPNAECIQKRWAEENNIDYDPDNWEIDLLIARVKAFKPDVLSTINYGLFKADFIQRLREECPSIRLVMRWVGSPFSDLSVFSAYDLVITNIPDVVSTLAEAGYPQAHHVDHAFEPDILNHIDTTRAPDVDFTFTGSVWKGRRLHGEREALLLELIRTTGLQMWVMTPQMPSLAEQFEWNARQALYDGVQLARKVGVPDGLLNRLPVTNKVMRWPVRPMDDLPFVHPTIIKHAQPPLFGLAMFQRLHDSRVVLNNHIDLSSNNASNMRLFEATGVGTCLLTDWKDNLSRLYEPDYEVVTYRSPAEAAEKARYLLDHEEERRKIAEAGQQRTLRDHTVFQRAQQIDALIRAGLK